MKDWAKLAEDITDARKAMQQQKVVLVEMKQLLGELKDLIEVVGNINTVVTALQGMVADLRSDTQAAK